MIDIHTHILPGIDDGADDLDEALEMARLAVADGTTHLIATPHHRDFGPLPQGEVERRVEALQVELDRADIALTLIPGYEVRLYDDVLDDWDHELAGPLGDSRYVLAEPLFHRYNARTDEILFELFDRGYIPIMAHPERIMPVQRDLSLIEPFLARGGLTQVTSGSLTSQKDWRAHQTALKMLRNSMVHIIASDAHKPYRRRPILSRARDVAAEIVGNAQADMLVIDNPMAVVENNLVSTLTMAA